MVNIARVSYPLEDFMGNVSAMSLESPIGDN